MKVLYTTDALATGDGREGHGRSGDGVLDVTLGLPTGMGGSGKGTNPEQLFAVGYAACYHNALRIVGRQAKADITDSAVGAQVTLGQTEEGDYQLAVILEVSLPNLDASTARELADQAHQMCPYSRATRGNIDVEVTLVSE
ncbi:organic hydroperoxide resistance protein [Gordonia polyisoprenivorans]|uniref:organic hydroperoxide resistance protein n=1 Tax=Gordonia polyisoprenivorans TaxID=84595 RepID=UPI001AD61764|nr:organic hydroperoxide resistance protein [Gordonia polyisoprenivorans]QTI69082.1 organic hydroperoxide resistance protein [Gordonia polyisoprenivorans]